MATAKPDDNFEIAPDVAEVLEELRSNRLQWVADEVEHRLREGAVERASFEVPRSRRPKTFEAVRGLTSDEQIAVLLRAIRNYLLLPSRIWKEATIELINTFNDHSTESLTAIELVPPGIDVDLINITNDDAESTIGHAMKVLDPFLKAYTVQKG
jgi:hypothetical protein